MNDGEFGLTFEEPTGAALAAGLQQLVPGRFARLDLRRRAERYSRTRFESRFRELVETESRKTSV